jgi:hypothetical protein
MDYRSQCILNDIAYVDRGEFWTIAHILAVAALMPNCFWSGDFEATSL